MFNTTLKYINMLLLLVTLKLLVLTEFILKKRSLLLLRFPSLKNCRSSFMKPVWLFLLEKHLFNVSKNSLE